MVPYLWVRVIVILSVPGPERKGVDLTPIQVVSVPETTVITRGAEGQGRTVSSDLCPWTKINSLKIK